MNSKAYTSLTEKFERWYRFSHLLNIASWDESVNMPAGGGDARAQAMAEMIKYLSEQLHDPQIGGWIEQAESDFKKMTPTEWEIANLREMKAKWQETCAISPDLASRQAKANAKSQQMWRELRPRNNWKDFLPFLKEVVNLSREEAAARAEATGLTPYDSLLQLYERGSSSSEIERHFATLVDFLPPFIDQVIEKQKREKVVIVKGDYPAPLQRELGIELMKLVGFDFERGRLDETHHPFCGGVPEDVRVTTRYSRSDFTSNVMAILHETGHASYQQNLPKDWLTQPVGNCMGMAIHESQSLFFEMQCSRSLGFLKFAAPMMKKHLGGCGDSDAFWDTENLYRLYTRVERSFIRVDADEVTYPLHVIMRFEIEKALIEKRLEVEDIPDVWNEKMKTYLGLSTEGNFKDGCMQDMHWTAGLFGYFPNYALGAMTAAQLFSAVKNSEPKAVQALGQGDWKPVREWLKANIWNRGCLYDANTLIRHATGESLNAKYFIEHLRNRYLAG